MSESFWHPEDKHWMAARKEQWRQVKQNLDIISSHHTPLKRKYHKYHKELFFQGTVNPECRSPYLWDSSEESFQATGHDPFESVLPLFRVWYHPEPDQIDFKALITPFIGPGNMDNLRTKFFDDYFEAGASCDRQMFSPIEGMMNGREALMIKLVCPGYDSRQPVIKFDNPRQSTTGQSQCAYPFTLERWVVSHTLLELMRDARFVPYAPGQYLWDHFSYAVEHFPEAVFKPRSGLSYEDWKRRFTSLIAEILAFEQRTDKSRHRPSTIAMVESLIDKYERKTFSDAMLKLWEEAKQNYATLREKPFSIIYFDAKELEEFGMSMEIQEERVSQWKQV